MLMPHALSERCMRAVATKLEPSEVKRSRAHNLLEDAQRSCLADGSSGKECCATARAPSNTQGIVGLRQG